MFTGAAPCSTVPRVVALVGPSAAGKSLLAERTAQMCEQQQQKGARAEIHTLGTDQFYKPLDQCPTFDPNNINWPQKRMPNAFQQRGNRDLNHPDAIHWGKTLKAIDDAIMSAASKDRVDGGTSIVLVEGLLLLAHTSGAALVRQRIDRWVILQDDPSDKVCQSTLWTRKWTRSGHLGQSSYRERGVTAEEYRVYWDEYVSRRWLEHGLGRVASVCPDALLLDCLMPVDVNARTLLNYLLN